MHFQLALAGSHHRSLLKLQDTRESEDLVLQNSSLAKCFTQKSIKSNSQM